MVSLTRGTTKPPQSFGWKPLGSGSYQHGISVFTV